jgi:tetratricopeptide (TPR) repeat protein
LIVLLVLAVALELVGGGVAFAGRSLWGHAGWYFDSQPDFRLRCGQVALKNGNLDRVDQVADHLDAEGYKDHAALLRGEAFFRQGKEYADREDKVRAAPLLLKAETELNKIRDKGDLRLQAAALLGQAYIYLRRMTEAERALEFVLSSWPNHVDAHRGLVSIYFDQGAMDKALAHLQRWAELDPQDGRPYRLMGLIYKDFKKWSLAVDAYQAALARNLPVSNVELDPARIRRELAECLVKQSRYSEALELLSQFDPLPEDVPVVEALRGQGLWSLGQADEARKVLDQALGEFHNSVDLLRMRARLHQEAREWDRAIGLLERALYLDPNDDVSRYQLAQVYENMGRKAEAAEQHRRVKQIQDALKEITRLDEEASARPRDGAVRLKLAEIYQKLGKPQEAEMWRQAAANCPPAPTSLPEPSPPKGKAP